MRTLLVALVVAPMLACAPALEPSVVSQPIVGGNTDTGDPGVVVMIAQQPGSMLGSLCSASIVSPHTVLTAAHCVSPAIVGATAEFAVYLGPDINNAGNNDFLAVKATHFNPDFDAKDLMNGADVGLLVMKDTLPVTPLAMSFTALEQSMVGQPARMVGYGKSSGNDGNGDSAGIKRQATTTMGALSEKLVRFGTGGTNTCEGDSGGPAFMTMGGKEVIVGIVSFGDQACAQLGVDTRVDVYAKSWVLPLIQAADPGFGSTLMGDVPPSHGCDASQSDRPSPQLLLVAAAIFFARRRSLAFRR